VAFGTLKLFDLDAWIYRQNKNAVFVFDFE